MVSHGDYIRDLLTRAPTIQHGGRKIFLNETVVLDDFNSDRYLEVVGYVRNKEAQLHRHYWNQQSLEDARNELILAKDKKDYSVGWSMYGKPKPGKTSQAGFCMQSMVLVKVRGTEYRLNVFYRTVEIAKKFYADLYFIKKCVMPFFGIKPRLATFYFSSVTLNNLYLPVILKFVTTSLPETFELCAKNDPKFFHAMCKWAKDYSDLERVFPYAEMKRMQSQVNKKNLAWLRWLAAQYREK